MSVNLLNHINKPAKVPDELESFFHLLVYYAVRYLRSNCVNVSSWVDSYFHTYAGPEQMYTCGAKSLTVEARGTLEIDSPVEGPLIFNSPLDYALAAILESLRAHYKVMNYALKSASRASRPKTAPKAPPAAPVFVMERVHSVIAGLDPEKVAKWEARPRRSLRDDDTPTAEERELADKVADHAFMIVHLADILHDPTWQGDDRIAPPASTPPSRADASEKPGGTSPPSDSEAAAPRSNKRQRTSGPERNVSLPARLRPTTRRTRTHARTQPVRARR